MEDCICGVYKLLVRLTLLISFFMSTLSFFIRDFEKPDFPVYSCNGHKEIINCIDGVGGLSTGCGAPEIVTGSRDGK